ncbi:MAG: ATP-binding protein [Pseudomonadota bacterium]
MANEHENSVGTKKHRPVWVFGLLCAFFGLLVIARPDLIGQLGFGFVLCFSALALYMREGKRRKDTENRQDETERAINSTLHSAMEAMQFPVYLLDGGANIHYANFHAKSVFGAIRIGDKITIRFRQPELKRIIETSVTQKEAVVADYNEPLPDDRWFQVGISPFDLPQQGQIKRGQYFLLTFHDQTEARRIDRMRSDFIANASHELRTPLASLLGYLETIKGPAKDDPEAQKRFTDVMLDQAERMTRLVNDLLSLSKIELKAHVKPSDVVDIAEVLYTVVSSLDALAAQMNVKIELDAEKKLNVVGDRDELTQVFENLIENACKYGQEGEKVLVGLRAIVENGKHLAQISVRDFGIGIAAEHQQRITERFYRVDVALSRAKQGTGLGLAIVKHILNRHGSRLNIKSTPGEGTEITVKLPIDSAQ